VKKILAFITVLALVTITGIAYMGCEKAGTTETTESVQTEAEETTAEATTEEVVAGESLHFILVNNMTTIYNFIPDYAGAQAACDDLKAWTGIDVTYEVVGPSENDILKEVEAMESAISKKPDGFMVICWDPNMLQAPIDKAVDAGIPVVTIDADSPQSKRLCYVGTDWYTLGKELGEALMEEIGGKGKVAIMGLVGADNMETAFQAFYDVAENYPDVEVVAKEHDNGEVETSAKIAAALMAKYPDLAGFAGFDAGSAPGIATAIKEAGKSGEVKLVGNDMNTAQLQALGEGTEQFIIGQKREFFGYWGVMTLFMHLKTSIKFTSDDAKIGAVNIPPRIVTGFHYATPDSVDLFMEAFEKYTEAK